MTSRYPIFSITLYMLVLCVLPAQGQEKIRFVIDSQPADSALTEFAKQANTTLLFPFELAERVKVNSLYGEYTLEQGLQALLRGTALEVEVDESGMLSVKSRIQEPPPGPQPAVQKQKEPESNGLERIAVVGTRSSPRTVAESPVPLDIIGEKSLATQGNGDVLDMLSELVPSLNVNDQPINDATSLVRPANLRGMASDHTLLLVNGKRRHRSAVITFLGGGLSDGAQGPDISVLPAAALKQVEVLRDGAAAQYGSDAIAGVINVVLKEEAQGGKVIVTGGGYSQGDGEMVQVQGNIGLPLADSGFFNVTAEYRQQQATSRSVQRDDARTLTEAGNPFVNDPAQIWGALKVENDAKLAINMGIPLTEEIEGYAFGNVARREIEGGFFYRHPHTRVGVFTGELQENQTPHLLVADLDGVGEGISCPKVPIADANVLDDPAYLLIADPNTAIGRNCFAYNEWFPGGFTPRFGGIIKDGSAFAGIRGMWPGDWQFDTSVGVGYSDIRYTLENTVNPSLGPATPLTFSPGGVSQVERTVNFDLSRAIDTVLEEPVNIAFGAEWRSESYYQKAGDPDSWRVGPYGYDPQNNISQGFSIGSNGFPGYQPASAGHWSRSNWALYTDMEMYLRPDWQLGLAARVEKFSDFGRTFDGKISTRVELNDTYSLRASASTGFKAPTVGQSNVINVTTAYSVNGLEDQATLPPTHPISQQLGAKPLLPEESVNLSMGLVVYWNERMYLTLDYFNIRLDDRISTTSAIRLSDEDVSTLVAAGHQDAESYTSVKYFANDFDTHTQGLDIILHVGFDSAIIRNELIAAYNWTQTQVERVSLYPRTGPDGERVYLPNLTPQRIRMLEDNLPAHRLNLTLHQNIKEVSATWRANYYSGFYEDHVDATAGMDIESGSIVTIDAELIWQINGTFSVAGGVKNVFDRRPHENPYKGVVGALYPPTAPSGINGAFYYLQSRLEF